MGDPAYELLPWLIKDYPGQGIRRDKHLFNEALNSARVVVEMAFGRLKGRWRILLKRCDIFYTFMPQIVGACCALHNLIEAFGESFPRHWTPTAAELNEYQQPSHFAPHNTLDSLAGSDIRDALCFYKNQN